MGGLKLWISVVVAACDGLLALRGWPYVRRRYVVINYHSISDSCRVRFARQLDLLVHLAKPVFAGRELSLAEGTLCVAITADDVFRSFVHNGIPELRRRRIPVTLFVPTGYIGCQSSWDDHGGENKVGEEVATMDELKRLAQYDNVEFGSHTVTHRDLTSLSEADVVSELRDSKAALEAAMGREVVALSFPYGRYGQRDVELARKVGYRFCFDSVPETIFGGAHSGLIGRVDVQPTDLEIEFRLKVSGAYRWVRWASAWKRNLRKRLGCSAINKAELLRG